MNVVFVYDNSSCTGCTDLEALNYDENATIDDGSCIFDGDLSYSII